MAKLSSINKNERRKKLVEKHAAKYAKLKAIADDTSKDETERLIARLKPTTFILACPTKRSLCWRKRESTVRALVLELNLQTTAASRQNCRLFTGTFRM